MDASVHYQHGPRNKPGLHNYQLLDWADEGDTQDLGIDAPSEDVTVNYSDRQRLCLPKCLIHVSMTFLPLGLV
jgi:hypothetical protein